MKVGLKHVRVRCEKTEFGTYLADDYKIVLLSDGTVVGNCELRDACPTVLPESGNVSFTVFEPHRGRGYATEALRHLCELAKERGMCELLVTCSVDNIASKRTIQACGGIKLDQLDVSGNEVYARRNIFLIQRFKILL